MAFLNQIQVVTSRKMECALNLTFWNKARTATANHHEPIMQTYDAMGPISLITTLIDLLMANLTQSETLTLNHKPGTRHHNSFYLLFVAVCDV